MDELQVGSVVVRGGSIGTNNIVVGTAVSVFTLIGSDNCSTLVGDFEVVGIKFVYDRGSSSVAIHCIPDSMITLLRGVRNDGVNVADQVCIGSVLTFNNGVTQFSIGGLCFHDPIINGGGVGIGGYFNVVMKKVR